MIMQKIRENTNYILTGSRHYIGELKKMFENFWISER